MLKMAIKMLSIGTVLLFMAAVSCIDIATAQEVYIPKDAQGYANYDDNVVIIRITPSMEIGQYLWLAFHEYAHFQYQDLSGREKANVRFWYYGLQNYTSTYSQTCTDCVSWEEEYAENYASKWRCTYYD